MFQASLGTCIVKSLHLGHMDPDLPDALVSRERNRVRNRTENKYWDYKKELTLEDAYQAAEFAKDVLAFHNSDGGMIAVGVSDDYAANGVSPVRVLDTKQIRDKVRRYLGSYVELFQDSVELSNGRLVWLIFIPPHKNAPVCMLADGPQRSNRPIFSRGQYYYRSGDEVKLCRSDADVEKLFRGASSEGLSAYHYEIDAPFFRLLDPNCEKFVGRREKIEEIKTKLDLRQPVVALDGLGGVGKTAIAIEAVRDLYAEQKYLFIISVSAKSKVWVGHVKPRRAAFAGLHSLLSELAAVIPYIEMTDDTLILKNSLIEFMKGQPGLILIDNLEEIEDENVLRFLCDEIPAPVKVLITSRVAKDLGARTISIPEMTFSEADDLIRSELDRLGYEMEDRDDECLKGIVTASGGVPLAIKWAAQIAAERRSLKEAWAILRGAGPTKQELLSFCFTTMYDALSDDAKNVARLIPYLAGEWKPMTISIALDIPVEAVRFAIFELSDKGIIFRARQDRPDDYSVLPLTKDFLSNKWHESHLQRAVDKRFSEMFSSGLSEGFLLEWPLARRVEFLADHARKKAEAGEYAVSLKLVQLAQTWVSELDSASLETQLRFLEGRSLYNCGNRGAGLAHMGQAIQSHRNNPCLKGEDLLTFGEALFAHGGTVSEKEASESVAAGVLIGGSLSDQLLRRFVECNLKRGDNKLIADVISRIQDGNLICSALDQIAGLLRTPQIRFTYQREWTLALHNLASSESVREEKKRHYLSDFDDIRERPVRNS
jgi:hypothetical protein